MFHRRAPKPTKIKHAIYLVAASFLGVLLSNIVHAVMEINYLHRAAANNLTVRWYGGCALPWSVQVGLLVLGVIGGYVLGRWWWRVIYIEQRWRRQ